MKIQVVRLITGEELIGYFDNESGHISGPMLIVVGSNPLNSQMKVQLVPWAMFAQGDTSIPLNKNHITYAAPADTQLYNKYTSLNGGIQLPATGKIQL